MENQYFKVGTIVNTQGLQGQVRVLAVSDFSQERFAKGALLGLFDQADKLVTTLTVASGKPVKNLWLVKFDGLDDINAVEKYKNFTLKIAKENLSQLTEHEFYYHDIIGLDVEADGVTIGKIREILQPGANDVWVVARPGQKDLLLPYIASVVTAVDLATGVVTVEIPEGLDD